MDHLPAPVGGSRPLVPFYALKKVYDPGDFIKRPIDEGYDDLDSLTEFGLKADTDEKTANTFLQEWLFFGFLACVLGEPVDSNEFHNVSQNCVQTTNYILERKILRWQKRHKDAQLKGCPVQQTSFVRASEAFNIARRFVSKHLSDIPLGADEGRPGRTSNPAPSRSPSSSVHLNVNPVLSLSVAVLGEILQRGRVQPNVLWEDQNGPWDNSGSQRWGYSRWCRDKLNARNWCPSEICRLESTMPGVCEVYYASGIRRKHSMDHSRCDCNHCCAPQPPAFGHVEGECDGTNCTDVYLNEREIEDMVLNSGKTPLVKYDALSGKAELYPIDLNERHMEDFGALSQAWKDVILSIGSDARGGNNRRIHQCQLRKLQNDFNKLVKRTSGESLDMNVPFYVDALMY